MYRFVIIALAQVGVFAVMAAKPGMPYIKMEDLEGVINPEKSQWQSIDEHSEFIMVDDLPITKSEGTRILNGGNEETGGAYDASNPYSVQPFIRGMTEYDAYAQAWRVLGFMIDCNTLADDDGSNDSGDNDAGCARYILWAAYVDLEYEGGGTGEYQYWNRTTKAWDDTSCYFANNQGSRCAKMDCHLENTHFSLLGFFKHRDAQDWMGQLFKHEGYCVWSQEEYAFMTTVQNAWPEGCVYSGSYTKKGEVLFYAIKPMKMGRITIALYLDNQCVEEYSSKPKEVENIIGNILLYGGSGDNSGDNNYYYDFSGESLAQSLDRWDNAFEAWLICQPCVAYDLKNMYSNSYYGNGRDLGDYYYNSFTCYDAAGYNDVNQCMKFSAKTTMKTATFRDLALGRTQNTLNEYTLAGYSYTHGEFIRSKVGNFLTYSFFIIITYLCCYSICFVRRSVKDTDYDLNEVKDVLVDHQHRMSENLQTMHGQTRQYVENISAKGERREGNRS